MDKLQPIIKNRFWILAGLIVPIAMYGFFSANAQLKAATQAREDALKSVLSAIPSGTTDPNQEYTAGLSKINQVYAASVDRSILQIWQKQQQLMTWPPVVETYVPEKFNGEFDYRGIVAYQEAYERLMRDLQARVEPVMPLTTQTGPGATLVRPAATQEMADVPWKQKVILAAALPQARFGKMRATSEEIWNAQIDIWLLRLLFDSVARLNEDKDSVTEAILRRIDVLNLIGGDGKPVLTGGGSTGSGDSSGSSYGAEMETSTPSGGSYGGGGGRAGQKSIAIAFDPAQEFGSDADEKSSGGAAEEDDDSSGSGSDFAGMTGGGRGSAKRLRYIANAEENPYYERGFYMSVIIMQDKIPDFLVELANSEWPVRVVRYHVGKNPYYTGIRSNTGGFNPGYESDAGSAFTYEAMETFGGRGSDGDEGSFGGVGAVPAGIEGVGSLTKNLPKIADDAMQHPNLVQVDLCGVITIFKQPLTIIEALANGTGTGAEGETPTANPDASTTDNGQTAADNPAAIPATTSPATEIIPAATTLENTAPATPGTPPTSNSPNALELENL